MLDSFSFSCLGIWSAFGRLWGNCFGHTDIDQVDCYFENYIWPTVCHESHISQSMCLLKWHEAIYCLGTENEDSLKNHFASLNDGLQFLQIFYSYSANEDFKHRIEHLVANMKKQLHSSLTCIRKQKNLTMKLDLVYADLRREMSYVVVKPGTDACDALYPKRSNTSISYFVRTNDLLFENIMELINSKWKADRISLVVKELEDVMKMLTSLKPLLTYIADVQYSFRLEEHKELLTTLESLIDSIDKTLCLIYLTVVGKMDEEMVLVVKNMFTKLIDKTVIRDMYVMTLTIDISIRVNILDREPYILHNLIRLLRSNARSHNSVHSKLYTELVHIRTYIAGLEKYERVKHFHYFQEAFEAILVQAVPIVCLCYDGHVTEETNSKLNGVLLDIFYWIKRIKSESQEIKLNHYPRTDNTGFLKSFLRYLEDLLKSRQMSILENEINMLISLLKVTIQGKLHEGLSACIIDLAYQAEYVIDLYLVRSRTKDVSRFFIALSNIIEQMKLMVKDMHVLCVEELPTQDVSRTSSPLVLTMASVQVNDNDVLVGIQEDVNVIKKYLLSGEVVLDAISIVGMAGIGKTTLASTIYNTPSVTQHFDIKVWCTVSQCYQMRDLLRKLLGQMNIDNNGDDEELADRLNKSLRMRRYLVILDDVWDTSAWNILKWYLPNDRQGSRILITTRNRSVAPETNNSKVHELSRLTQEESWELFQKKLPHGEGLPADLLKIAKGMAMHCKGLPLSIVIVAGLLSDIGRSEKKWSEIAENMTSFVLTDPQSKCKAILELSYNHLPDHLKSCFLYLGVFPEDHEISCTHLTRLWIAEGFVQDTESKEIEEVAEKYMEDLIGRSLITCASERPEGGIKTCRIHDLLRDFCIVKAREEHFLSVLTKRYTYQPLKDPRRLSINTKGSGHMLHFNNFNFSCHSVRSIIHFGRLESSEIDERIESFDMPLLKVLEIGALFTHPTSNMSSLIHLRYLAIWKIMFWDRSVLLSDITKLRNLETLILRSKTELVVEVPDSIWDLGKLRHVCICTYSSFHVDRKRGEKSLVLLENLKSLSKPCLTSGDSKWLSKLPGLQKLSCVFSHSRDNSFKCCGFPVLQNNDQLLSLKVRNGFDKGTNLRCNSCKLHFPGSLRKVTLSNFEFHSTDISDIGRALPGLEVLKLYDSLLVLPLLMWIVKEADFPKLKVLKLRNLRFSHWIVDSENSFPCLEQLWIEDCNNLEKIPMVFGNVTSLSRILVKGCKPSADDSARGIEAIQRDDQNTELKVRIIPRKSY